MGFFDDLPVPEPPKWTHAHSRLHIRLDPGRNVAPITLAAGGLLVRRPDFVLFANEFRVYPFGFEFMVTFLQEPLPADSPTRERGSQSPFFPHRRADEPALDPERVLKFGVRFADGRSAVLGTPGRGLSGRESHDRPPAMYPRSHLRSSYGARGRWQHAIWVWGMPEEGDVSLLYWWADRDVPESVLELDGDALREAAGRARVLWEEPEEPRPENVKSVAPESVESEDEDGEGGDVVE